jgi:hypothetical protein
MRFVDGEQPHPALVEHDQGFGAKQGLRGHVQQFDLARPDAPDRGRVLAHAQRAVQEGGDHAQLAQGVHLVLHEGDEGRDDHGQSIG